jgi:hypothetical protein
MLNILSARGQFLAASILLALVTGLSGCAAPGPTPKSVADWHDAVVAVREQSVTTFRVVNDLVRETQIKRAANLSVLKEEDFHPGLDAESLATWKGTAEV